MCCSYKLHLLQHILTCILLYVILESQDFNTMTLITVMQYVMFNSVPMDLVMPIKGLNKKEDRVKMLLKYLRKFGIPEEYIFTESDLFEFKNIPKVTRCIAMLAKMVNTVVKMYCWKKYLIIFGFIPMHIYFYPLVLRD